MAEPLKTFFSPALVRRLAGDIERVHPSFPSRAFIRDATKGLDELELLDRGKHITRALEKHLPASFPDAIDILLRSLGPEHATDELIGVGMAPFYYLPHTQYVATRGLDHFELSMHAQYELTKRFSAESSIRPFLAADPERTLATLRQWASDPNAHVRRPRVGGNASSPSVGDARAVTRHQRRAGHRAPGAAQGRSDAAGAP